MYAIRANSELAIIEVVIDGVLDATELVRCISQAWALSEAGLVSGVLADIRGTERCGLDQGLVVAALQSRATLDIKLAVAPSERVAQITQRLLKRAGLAADQARAFKSPESAGQWLSVGETARNGPTTR